MFNESCGCGRNHHATGRILQYMYQEKKSIEHLSELHFASQQMLCGTDIGPQLPDALNQCCLLLELDALAVYLQPTQNTDTLSDNNTPTTSPIYTNQGLDTVTSLVPDSWNADVDYQILVFPHCTFKPRVWAIV